MSSSLLQLSRQKLIRLGGKLYKIRYTAEDKQRRNDYFTSGTGSLTPDEDTLLQDIGLTDIDKQLSENDKHKLPEFFNALPDCQTSAAISLSAKCFMPHHIIGSIIEHAAIESEVAHIESLKKERPTSDLLAATAIKLTDLAKRVLGPSPLITGTPAIRQLSPSDINDFFLLRV